MKKILSIIFCLMAVTIGIHAQDNYGKIFLQHDGNIVGTYAYNEMNKAIEAASEGDVIYLSKGRFSGGFTIDKSISIIGSGAANTNGNNYTFFDWGNGGNNEFYIQNNNQTIANVTIEGVYFGPTFYVNSSVDELTFKKCYFSNNIYFQNNGNNTTCKKVTIDRCRCLYISPNERVEDLTAKNCKIYSIGGQGNTSSALKYINCNIRRIETNTKAMVVNCIVNEVGNGTSDYLSTNTILVNTLYHNMNGYDPMEKTSQQDCYATTETLITNNDYACSMTKDQLQSAGYLGVDGTVVGIEGGVNPFSLTLHAPNVTSKGANVDLNNKKVTISVTATAN